MVVSKSFDASIKKVPNSQSNNQQFLTQGGVYSKDHENKVKDVILKPERPQFRFGSFMPKCDRTSNHFGFKGEYSKPVTLNNLPTFQPIKNHRSQKQLFNKTLIPKFNTPFVNNDDWEIFAHNHIITEMTATAKANELKCRRHTSDNDDILPLEIRNNDKLKKFWRRRYHLFSKFDEGIKLDEESWFSVTPELLAKHMAQRCKCDIIVDAFCGAGGNTIQFAMTCNKVIAIDIDAKKIELAKNNAHVYGVLDKIEFIVGDFFQLADRLKADVIFFSPPWGGPSYTKEIVFDLETMLLPVSISKLLEAGRKITSNIAVFLPKNSNIKSLIDNINNCVEVERNYFKNIPIGITAYYNELINLK